MDETQEEHLKRLFDHLTHWQDVYEEAKRIYDGIPPLLAHDGPEGKFSCQNCGNCCHFVEHYPWIYLPDLLYWLSLYGRNPLVPYFLFALIEIEDYDDNVGLGITPKEGLRSLIDVLENIPNVEREIIDSYIALEEWGKSQIKNYDPNSSECFFYDPDKEHHCIIYDYRPLQCKVHPSDYEMLTKVNPEVSKLDEYEIAELNRENDEDPFCIPEAFQPPLNEGKTYPIPEDVLKMANVEKICYLTTQWMENDIFSDLITCLGEIFYEEVMHKQTDKDLGIQIQKFVQKFR